MATLRKGIVPDMNQTSTRTRDRSPVLKSIAPTVAAAVLGNAFVGRDAMSWFQELRKPAMQLPLPGFMAVAGMYYASIGTVLYRSAARQDHRAYRLAMLVLCGNELWNGVLFGRRSTRGGFFGMLAFTVPVSLLQLSVKEDKVSTLALGPYTAWVIGYDIPWTYLLWRYNQ